VSQLKYLGGILILIALAIIPTGTFEDVFTTIPLIAWNSLMYWSVLFPVACIIGIIGIYMVVKL
jgi:hypothetical protein